MTDRTLTAVPVPAPGLSIYPLTAVLIWTGNTLVTKAAADQISPLSITLYRWLLAGMILTPFVLAGVVRQRAAILAQLPRLALLGCLGMAIYQGLAYQAARTTSAINMGVIVAMMPLIASFLSSRLAGESLCAMRLFGAALSLAGLMIVSTGGHPATLLQHGVHSGDALMLVAVAANALYGVLIKRWPMPLSTWQQLYVQILCGMLLILPFWWLSAPRPVTASTVPLILYAGTLASIGAPFCWMRGVKQLGPARASLYMNLLPILVALAAAALLQEALHPYHLVGALLALAGVWLGIGTRRR